MVCVCLFQKKKKKEKLSQFLKELVNNYFTPKKSKIESDLDESVYRNDGGALGGW